MRLNVNNYYFHSIKGQYKTSLKTLDSILKDGYIKSNKDIDHNITNTSGMHKPDEICLTEYTNHKVITTQSAFSIFIANNPTLILDKEIDTFKPIITPTIYLTDEMILSGNHSNIYDEVRTKNPIPISHIKGVSFPLTELLNDNFKYLFYTDEMIYKIATGQLTGCIPQNIIQDNESYKLSRIVFLRNILKEIRNTLKKYDTRVPIYDFYLEGEEPVFKLLKRR